MQNEYSFHSMILMANNEKVFVAEYHLLNLLNKSNFPITILYIHPDIEATDYSPEQQFNFSNNLLIMLG